MPPPKFHVAFVQLFCPEFHADFIPNIHAPYTQHYMTQSTVFGYDSDSDNEDLIFDDLLVESDEEDEEEEEEEGLTDSDDDDDDLVDPYQKKLNAYKRSHLQKCRQQLHNHDNGPYLKCTFAVRNYRRIIQHESSYRPQLIQKYYDPDQRCFAIIKTWYIKWIQRCWRKVLSARRRIIWKRGTPIEQFYFSQNGHWSPACSQFPSLQGMLFR